MSPKSTFHLCRTSAGAAANDRIETGQAVSCAVARTMCSLAEVNAAESAKRCSALLQTSLLRITFPRSGEEHTSSWMAVRSVDCFQEQFGTAAVIFFQFSFGGDPFEAKTPVRKPSKCRGAAASRSRTSHHHRLLVSVAFDSAELHYHNNNASCGLALPPSASHRAKVDIRHQSRSSASVPLESGRVLHERTRPPTTPFYHNTIAVCAFCTEYDAPAAKVLIACEKCHSMRTADQIAPR